LYPPVCGPLPCRRAQSCSSRSPVGGRVPSCMFRRFSASGSTRPGYVRDSVSASVMTSGPSVAANTKYSRSGPLRLYHSLHLLIRTSPAHTRRSPRQPPTGMPLGAQLRLLPFAAIPRTSTAYKRILRSSADCNMDRHCPEARPNRCTNSSERDAAPRRRVTLPSLRPRPFSGRVAVDLLRAS
jgi:hypothetical protein